MDLRQSLFRIESTYRNAMIVAIAHEAGAFNNVVLKRMAQILGKPRDQVVKAISRALEDHLSQRKVYEKIDPELHDRAVDVTGFGGSSRRRDRKPNR